MSLSAARVINYRRHLRALSICLFLVLAPVILMAVLWKLFPVGTWLLAVSAFCVEVVVKGKYCYSNQCPLHAVHSNQRKNLKIPPFMIISI